ncbi:MAG: alpha-L-glutamate ligase-like protein [Gammaproteobacteria bacterium]|jgi:alpha-L-glutamate ligase-like protein|nr:alpha-L-glutamate ligase-like protein [Gammaproteobacteria bacterium]
MRGWSNPARLKALGVMGMNCRNIEFVSRYNDRRLYPLVDDKLKTKLLAHDHGLATPALRSVIRRQHEIRQLGQRLEGLDGFAIKPARGSGGKGILVVSGRRGDRFVKASGKEVTIDDLGRHMSNVIAGLHSLAGTPDVAIIEDLIRLDPHFDGYSHEGIPDIRIIVFRGYPVMAMLRLATHASDGKANLHQGAVGVGLDMATGDGIHAVHFGHRIHTHPDTGMALDRIVTPYWRTLLTLAARCYEMTGLGYIGADIVLDRDRGPALLELNARPGLSIQVANGSGLLPRLRHIEALTQTRSPEQRADYSMGVFASRGTRQDAGELSAGRAGDTRKSVG